MKRHPNLQQGPFAIQTGPPLLAQDHMFMTSQNAFLTSQQMSRTALDPSACFGVPKMQPGLEVDPRMAPVLNNGITSNVMLQQQLAAAMLAQSMDSAGEVSNSQGSDDLSMHNVSGTMVNKMLMNMNIPAAQFSKALNFQTIAENGISGRTEQGAAVYDVENVDDDLEDADSETLEDEESLDRQSLDRQSLDTSRDLVEQQQSQNQAALMSKFRQLREWQQRQQELLMQQQQHQLDLLRDEQERVQRIIAKQREKQWGPPANTRNGFVSTVAEGTQFSSPRAASHRSANTRTENFTHPTQNGRPVPMFPQQNPSAQALYQAANGDLDSDRGSEHSLVEEGVYPLPDQEPEELQGHMAPKGTGNHKVHHPHLGGQRTAPQQAGVAVGPYGDHRLHQQLPFSAKETGQPPAHGNWNFRPEAEYSNGFGVDDDEHVSASQNVSDDESSIAYDAHGHGVRTVKNSHTDFNHNHDALDFREGVATMGEMGNFIQKVSPRLNEQYYNEAEGEFYSSRQDIEQEDCEESQDEEEEEEEDQNEDECECEHKEKDFDEMPVLGLGATKKTFEQLLEEELRKEEERMQNQSSSATSSSGKKQFLKKGACVARFTSSGRAKERKRTQKSRTKPIDHGQHKTADQKTSRSNGTSNGTTGTSSNGGGKSTSGTNTRLNNTPVTRGLPPKGPTVSRKVSPTSTEPTKQQEQRNQPVQRKQSNLKQLTKDRVNNQRNKPEAANEPPKEPDKPLQRLELKKPSVLKVPEKPGIVRPTTGPHSVDPCDTPSKYSDTSSLGETSFITRLTARAEQEVVDGELLEEFELLEQYADDNASFLSNISAVNRVVQQNKGPPRNHKMPPIASIVKPPARTQPPAPPAPAVTCQHASSSDEDDDDDTSASTDLEEDNSQNYDGEALKDLDDANKSNEEHDNTLVESAEEEAQDHTPAAQSKSEPAIRPMQRKVALMDPSRTNLLASVQQFSDSDAEVNKNQSDLSDDDVSQSEDTTHQAKGDQSQAVSQTLPQTQSQNRNEYSYPETNEDKRTNERRSERNDPAVHDMNFDDDMDAWDDSQCETPTTNSAEPLIRRSILNRNSGAGDSTDKSTPPTSQLVSKLFPKLRQEKPKPKVEPETAQRLATATQSEPSDGVQSKLLRDKLTELEREIDKFRSENSNLAKLRKEREEGLVQLKKEMAEFEKQKNDELRRLQEFKAEETKKLKREKKQFEQHQQTMRAMPNKKERDEIEMLKSQLSELQEEGKRKESRWTSSMSRLREKCESLTAENSELKDEIKVLEKQRLQTWQQREAAPKVKEEASRPPPVKKSTLQPVKSPQPEPQPTRHGLSDSALGLSTNLDLDESDLRVSEEPPTPRGITGASPRHPEMAFTPTPYQQSKLTLSPTSETAMPVEVKKPIPRKKATPVGLANAFDKGDEQYEEVSHQDGKVERMYSNGAREILFTNGTRKQISATGESIIVSFFNGDMKQILPDQRVVYFYSDVQTTHTTYPDGLEIFQFANQQMEKHYPDGTTEITFPDQTIKYLFPSGIEENIFPDGTVIRIEKNGNKTVEFPNGQREVHTQHYKRREYPDGTVKTVYPDGKQETRYSSGRVRVKDNVGNVIVDKRI